MAVSYEGGSPPRSFPNTRLVGIVGRVLNPEAPEGISSHSSHIYESLHIDRVVSVGRRFASSLREVYEGGARDNG